MEVGIEVRRPCMYILVRWPQCDRWHAAWQQPERSQGIVAQLDLSSLMAAGVEQGLVLETFQR